MSLIGQGDSRRDSGSRITRWLRKVEDLGHDESMVQQARPARPEHIIRRLSRDDASVLAGLVSANREFMAPWDAIRPETYYTEAGQRELIEEVLRREKDGLAYPAVVLEDGGAICGRITMTAIERGAFQSGRIGYWVSEHAGGRGLAQAGVAEIVRLGFDQLGLHRIEAATVLNNLRSQRVLLGNGFSRFGTAPAYVKIAGRWQDHALFQVTAD